MNRLLAFSAALALAGCNPEIRLSKADGIPPVAGSAEVTIENYRCGDPIPAGEHTITTRPVAGGCEFTFDRDVQVLKATDYEKIPELSGAGTLLQALELTITRLSFTDSSTGAALDPATRLRSATLFANGQQVADQAALASLPKTVRLEGEALVGIKARVDARLPASVRMRAVVVVLDPPAPPKKLKVDYDAQPTLVLGAPGLKL